MARSLMSRSTGKKLTDLDHLKQSITDILSTPLGTRVMRRDYGCAIFDFVDRGITPQNTTAWYAAIADALDKWEPRLRLRGIEVDATCMDQGILGITLEGIYTITGDLARLESLEIPVNIS